MVPNLN
jgi:hypothetical protein